MVPALLCIAAFVVCTLCDYVVVVSQSAHFNERTVKQELQASLDIQKNPNELYETEYVLKLNRI